MRDDDDKLTDEEAAALYAEVVANGGPITQEDINTACRRLAAEGVIEWDETNLRARLTPQENS